MLPRLPLIRCRQHTSARTRDLESVLLDTGHQNVFNPSVAVHDGRVHLAYRALGPHGEKPFRAYLVHQLQDGSWTHTDLSALAAGHGVPMVADPKLVVLGADLHVTFNSGWDRTQNDLYLMRLAPEPGPPQRCEVPGRQRVEKNWGFVPHPDGGLAVLYALQPVTLLRLASGEIGDGPLGFRREGPAAGADTSSLTLASQPVVDGDDLLVLGHEKLRVRGRRGYAGRAVRVRSWSDGGTAEVSRTRLLASLAELRDAAPRHNPHLLFATYFSGLAIDGSRALLAYGVNDKRFGLAELPRDRLWP